MRRAATSVAVAVALLAVGPARAHAPPSEDTVDRYLKLSPMGDRVRLAYTVVFGQRPGRALRPRLDRDRDRAISSAEAQPLGDDLGRQVRTALTVAVDGQPIAVSWDRVEVGLGTPTVDAGALSVDLIAYLCVGPGRHTLLVRDDLTLPDLGSTELTLEPASGVTIEARSLGGAAMTDDVVTWTGRGGPLATGLELRFFAGSGAARPSDRRCRAPGRDEATAYRVGVGVGLLIGGGLALAALAWWRRRRRAA